MSQMLSSLPNQAFDCFREDLLVYLTQRFGSLRLANQILNETRLQLGDDSVLSMVGNPAVYLMGFALSIGLKMTGQGSKPEVRNELLD